MVNITDVHRWFARFNSGRYQNGNFSDYHNDSCCFYAKTQECGTIRTYSKFSYHRPCCDSRVIFFSTVLFFSTVAMCVTENQNGFTLSQIAFETTSAIGTVGLSTGITPFLTTKVNLLSLALMLLGRLGPLTLVAALTFNLKTKRYNYPEETIIVG